MFNGQCFKTDRTKKNQTYSKTSTTCDTLCVKISSNVKILSKSVHLRTRYCKVKVPYQSPQKRGEVTYRAEIDHLNNRKCTIKQPICGECPLSRDCNEVVIFEAKFDCFVGLTRRYTKWTGHVWSKWWGYASWPISQTAQQKTPPVL